LNADKKYRFVTDDSINKSVDEHVDAKGGMMLRAILYFICITYAHTDKLTSCGLC